MKNEKPFFVLPIVNRTALEFNCSFTRNVLISFSEKSPSIL
jgi:hypothetical protein